MSKKLFALLLSAAAAASSNAASTLEAAQPVPASAPASAGAPNSGVGYPTVAAALEALRADPAVRWKVQDGWTLALDSPHQALWSFSPAGQPAYPAVIKRALVKRDGGTLVEMKVLCQAPRAACDAMVKQYALRTRDALARGRERAASGASAPLSVPSASAPAN